ncbi:MAG TPA: glycerophosphodiester phosphodiesterase [Polyangiaceae bacterium]|jgi:glycerophosphoryl diester phosphodiesterase
MTVWTTAPLVVGHRGGRGEGWPLENSLAAFERARAEGARAVELDVRTHEGQVIVHHDPQRASLAELRALGVPTLAEVLAWARERDVAVNVELKHDVPHRAALAQATARSVRASRADVLLSSFDPLLLATAGALAPRAPRALLVHRGQGRWAGVMQEAARAPFCGALHLERTQTEPEALARYRRRGLRLGVWTVNDPREAVDLVALGVATIISDAPGAILAALGRVPR